MAPTDETVLRMVTEAANAAKPCPTNREIADALQLSSNSGPVLILARLAKAGLITVEQFQCERRVTINATGRRTKVYNTQPHWRDVPEGERKPSTYRPRPRTISRVEQRVKIEHCKIVDRDPCWRCGTRGDLGCEHRKPSQ
jgi:hypothetical protein